MLGSTSAMVSSLFEDEVFVQVGSRDLFGLCLLSESILLGNFRCLRCYDNVTLILMECLSIFH